MSANPEMDHEVEQGEDQLSEKPDEEISLKPQQVEMFSPKKSESSKAVMGKEKNKLGAVGIKSAEEERLLREEEERRRRAETPSTSIFLLEEKERSKNSQNKLKEKEVYQTYKKSIKVKFNKSKGSKTITSKTGVLINKNQS